MSNNQPTIPPSHPRLRTQFGILFGFVGIFIVVIVCFGVSWRLWNIHAERREEERRQRLLEAGGGLRDGVGEKGKERVVRDFRVEREDREDAVVEEE